MSKIEKIGTVEYLSVRSHANRYYLPLKSDLVTALDLKRGDILKVKIIERRTKEAGGE